MDITTDSTMDVDGLAQQYRLDVTVLGDRSREVFQAPIAGQCQHQATMVKMWNRKRFLADNVYLDETSSGEARVVKLIHWKGGRKSYPTELQVVGRISKKRNRNLFVQFLGWFPSQDHVAFVTEYCPLGDVSQCFQEPVTELVGRDICGQLIEGLGNLHQMNITHRDIKPQNVLVMRKDPIWVKISDFGISKLALEGQTELRTRAGTEGYMAPEILGLLDDYKEDSSYTCAVDIWSLGCFIFYILTTATPFPTYGSLQDFCWGLSAFPEALLVDNGVGSSGRLFIKYLTTIQPHERPQASIDLVSHWVIAEDSRSSTPLSFSQDTNREVIKLGKLPEKRIAQASTVETSSREAIRLGKRPENTSSSTEHSKHREPGPIEPLTIGVGLIPSCNCSSLDDEMDYHASELWYTIKDGVFDLGRIRPLLDLGADPNKLRDGYTAFHRTAERGPVETLELLIQYGADLTIKTRPHEETALHLVTYQEDTPKLKALLNQRANVDVQAADGDTALHLTILRFRGIEAIQMLLANGASTEIKGRNGYAPLQYAISLGIEAKAICLLDNGARPDVQDNLGRTPLHQAVSSDRLSIRFIKRLLEVGADANQADNSNCTALYEAAKWNRQDVMSYLVDNGARSEVEPPGLQRRLQWMQLWRKLPWPLGN